MKISNQNKREDENGQNLLEEQQTIAKRMGIDSNDSASMITEIGQVQLIHIKKKLKMKFIKESISKEKCLKRETMRKSKNSLAINH